MQQSLGAYPVCDQHSNRYTMANSRVHFCWVQSKTPTSILLILYHSANNKQINKQTRFWIVYVKTKNPYVVPKNTNISLFKHKVVLTTPNFSSNVRVKTKSTTGLEETSNELRPYTCICRSGLLTQAYNKN